MLSPWPTSTSSRLRLRFKMMFFYYLLIVVSLFHFTHSDGNLSRFCALSLTQTSWTLSGLLIAPTPKILKFQVCCPARRTLVNRLLPLLPQITTRSPATSVWARRRRWCPSAKIRCRNWKTWRRCSFRTAALTFVETCRSVSKHMEETVSFSDCIILFCWSKDLETELLIQKQMLLIWRV